MKKLLALFWLAAATAAMSVFAEPYCGVDKLPNLIKCLPAPPKPGSADFARDVARYEWGKEQRKDPERAALAKRDAIWSFSAVADAFSKPFGMEISQAKTPRIWKVFEDSLSTTDQMRVAPKAFYHRRRPFAYFNEEPLCPKEDGVWRDEGSYPSGHTMRSMVAALVFAEINPERADKIFVRAMQYGESRVIAGAHWQSDVDMTRLAAAIAYSRLQTIPTFRIDMDIAKREFAALAKTRPDSEGTIVTAIMTPTELLDHPALIALLGAVGALVLCFAVAGIYITLRNVRVLKILLHMEKLGYKRSPDGWWTMKRMNEILKAADSMPTLGSAKMDATRQKLREQSGSPVFGRLIAALALLFAAMVALMAIATGRAIVALALLPAAVVFLAFHHAIKHTDKSWRCKESERK